MAIELTFEDFLQGTFAVIFVLISLIVGIKLLTKYKIYKQKSFLLAGLSWIGIATPWFSNASEFLSVLIVGTPLIDKTYIFISYFAVPIALLFWIALYSGFKFPKKQKVILLIFLIQGAIYDIIFTYFVITDLSVVGSKPGLFNDELELPFLMYILVVLIIVLITGISFGLDSIKSEKSDVKLKGKFLIVAWVSFFVGALLDAGLFTIGILGLIVVRLILISSAIEFYFGFFLPDSLKKRLLKSE